LFIHFNYSLYAIFIGGIHNTKKQRISSTYIYIYVYIKIEERIYNISKKKRPEKMWWYLEPDGRPSARSGTARGAGATSGKFLCEKIGEKNYESGRLSRPALSRIRHRAKRKLWRVARNPLRHATKRPCSLRNATSGCRDPSGFSVLQSINVVSDQCGVRSMWCPINVMSDQCDVRSM